METQVELIERTLDVTRVGCKFSRVKSIGRQSFRGRAARAIAHGKVGHASTTDGLTDDQLIQRAIATARVNVPPTLSFPSEIASNECRDSKIDHMTESDLRDWTRQILRSIQQNKPAVAIELEVSRVSETVDLHNTNGGETHFTRGRLEVEAWVERHAAGEVLVTLDDFATAQLDDSHLEFARRLARRLRWARKPVEPVTGPQSVIFSPSAFASLLQPMLYALNGTFVFPSSSRGSKRSSGFASKIGRQTFDPQFSLFDDATLPDRPYSAPVDHEGTRGQCTALIQAGVVNTFYHNLISAAQAGARSTGNGWRDMLNPPAPSPTNVRVQGGSVTLPDMLQNLSDGLLIDQIAESDAASGLTGEFSRTILLAYQFKRGRVVGYVRGANVSGDLYRSLQNIEALSCDGYWSNDVFTPYIQLGGVTLSA